MTNKIQYEQKEGIWGIGVDKGKGEWEGKKKG